MANQKWKCEHGCDQARWIKRTGHGCPHIEALLGPHSGFSTKRYSIGLDERAPNVKSAEDLYIEKEREESLASAGGDDWDGEPMPDAERFKILVQQYTDLSDVKANVLEARLVRGLTFKEIAIEFGYAEASVAGKAFRDAIEMLRRGIKE